MRIATWTVTSVKQRLEHLLTFLKSAEPDVVCLQELKCVDEAFPRADVEAAGYNVATHGQKAYNGVAILSKRPLEDVRQGLPGDDTDEQARHPRGALANAPGRGAGDPPARRRAPGAAGRRYGRAGPIPRRSRSDRSGHRARRLDLSAERQP